MAERTEELREDIQERRQRIGHTVDQIENRVSPSRVAARTGDRMGDKLNDWKDKIMGSDEYGGDGAMAEAGQKVAETPEMIRRRTQGNPMAAGLIAFGGGLLVGSLLPETKAEHRAVERMEPVLRDVEPEIRQAGRQVMGDVKDVARETAEDMKETAAESADRIRSEARGT